MTKMILNRLFFGLTTGAIAYDANNEFQFFGGANRFLRSLKIAAVISMDYKWHLYNLADGNANKEKVRKIFLNWQ